MLVPFYAFLDIMKRILITGATEIVAVRLAQPARSDSGNPRNPWQRRAEAPDLSPRGGED
jgi:hypothetical protein